MYTIHCKLKGAVAFEKMGVHAHLDARVEAILTILEPPEVMRAADKPGDEAHWEINNIGDVGIVLCRAKEAGDRPDPFYWALIPWHSIVVLEVTDRASWDEVA